MSNSFGPRVTLHGLAVMHPLLRPLIEQPESLGIPLEALGAAIQGADHAAWARQSSEQLVRRLVPTHLNPDRILSTLYLQLPYPPPPGFSLHNASGNIQLIQDERQVFYRAFLSSQRHFHPSDLFEPLQDKTLRLYLKTIQASGEIDALQDAGDKPMPTVLDLFELTAEKFNQYPDNPEAIVPLHGPLSTYNMALLRQVVMHFVCGELAARDLFAQHGVPVRFATTPTRRDLEGIFHHMTCRAYLMELLFTPEKFATLPGGIHQARWYWSQFLEQVLLDSFQPVPPGAPLAVNDIVVYFRSVDDLKENDARHFGRVALVRGDHVWVESKWGPATNPCLHPIAHVQSSVYGASYLVARPRYPNQHLTGEQQSFASAGFRMPAQSEMSPAHVIALVQKYCRFLLACRAHGWFHEEF